MNKSEKENSVKIKVYIYTATNGYSWQGCDDDLAESLRACLGSSWKNAAPDGSIQLGGIRRGTVGNLNGTAVYRVHVRRSGDFAGRDSDYVALAFIPFKDIGERSVDYAALWSHDLLKEPLGKDKSLAGHEIDLDAALVDETETDDYWTDEGSPVDASAGDEAAVLARLGAAFQSRRSELGSFVASIFGDGSGRVFFQARYKPFPAVVQEVDARRKYEKSRHGSGGEKERAKAFRSWSDAVDALLEMTDGPGGGSLCHFLGLRQFAEAEKAALNAGNGRNEVESVVRDRLDLAQNVLQALETHLTGDDDKFLHALDTLLKKVDPLVSNVGETFHVRLKNLKGSLTQIEKDSKAVSSWLKAQRSGTRDSLDGENDAPIGISPLWAELIGNYRKNLCDLKREVERLEKVKTSQKSSAAPVETKQRNSTDAPSGSVGSGQRAARSSLTHFGLVGILLGAIGLVIAFLAGFLTCQLIGMQGCGVPLESEDAHPLQTASSNFVPDEVANFVPPTDADSADKFRAESGEATSSDHRATSDPKGKNRLAPNSTPEAVREPAGKPIQQDEPADDSVSNATASNDRDMGGK